MISERMREWRFQRTVIDELKKQRREQIRLRMAEIRKRAKYWENAGLKKW